MLSRSLASIASSTVNPRAVARFWIRTGAVSSGSSTAPMHRRSRTSRSEGSAPCTGSVNGPANARLTSLWSTLSSEPESLACRSAHSWAVS